MSAEGSVLYRRILVEIQHSTDGETPTVLYVTREANGFALLLETPEGVMCLDWSTYNQHGLIEKAVRWEE